MKIEYAISAGPGTLIDYGVADHLHYGEGVVIVTTLLADGTYDDNCFIRAANETPLTLISEACPDDCQTGQ